MATNRKKPRYAPRQRLQDKRLSRKIAILKPRQFDLNVASEPRITGPWLVAIGLIGGAALEILAWSFGFGLLRDLASFAIFAAVYFILTMLCVACVGLGMNTGGAGSVICGAIVCVVLGTLCLLTILIAFLATFLRFPCCAG